MVVEITADQIESIETAEVFADDMLDAFARELDPVADDVVLVPVSPVGKVTLFEPKTASGVDDNTPYILVESLTSRGGLTNRAVLVPGANQDAEPTVVDMRTA